MKKFVSIAPLLVLSLFFSCNPTGSDDNQPGNRQPGDPITVSGRLGPGLSVAPSVARGGTAARSIAGAVSGIASIPVIAGNAGIGPGTEVLPVATDGSFSITLQPGADESALLLLVNENYATLEEKAGGFVSLADPSGVDLSLLPLGNARRDLEFGTISSGQTGVTSEYSLSEQALNFSETFDTLLETAYRDNLFKHAKNMYVNLDKTSGQWIMERTSCTARSNAVKAENIYIPITDWVFTSGFNMRIDVLEPAGHNYDSLISNVDDIEIIPPSVITLKGTDPDYAFGPETPIRLSDGLSLPSDASFSFWEGDNGGYVIDFDGEEKLGDGFWRFNLIKAGLKTELALFDMQSVDPFTPDDSQAFIYYIPSIRLNTDAVSKIISIELSWSAWDPVVREYRIITDYSAFKALVSSYGTGIVRSLSDSDGNGYNDEERFSSGTLCIPTRDWYVRNAPVTGSQVDWVSVVYTIAGVEYSFNLYTE